MNRRRLITAMATLATLAVPCGAARAGAPRDLAFELHQGGHHTRLNLRVDGNQVSGTLNEGAVKLELRGQLAGRKLQGQLVLPGLAMPLATLNAELQADQVELTLQAAQGGEPTRLLLRRVGAPAPAAPAGGGIDAQLVGRWQQQNMTQSAGGAGGFASFTTLRTLVLAPDGRAQQSMRSVGGGGGWSHRSGDELEFSGRWQTRDGMLWVLADGQAAFQNVGRYQLADGRLVLESGGRRQVWRR